MFTVKIAYVRSDGKIVIIDETVNSAEMFGELITQIYTVGFEHETHIIKPFDIVSVYAYENR